MRNFDIFHHYIPHQLNLTCVQLFEEIESRMSSRHNGQ